MFFIVLIPYFKLKIKRKGHYDIRKKLTAFGGR